MIHTEKTRRAANRAVGFVLLSLGFAVAGCARPAPPIPPPVPDPAPGAIVASVFFVGDAGDPHEGGEPVLRGLARELESRPDSTLLVFLGDNVYPRGMPDSTDKSRYESERQLRAQVDVADSAGIPAVFLPGNHDWDKGGKGGWDAILRQEEYIASFRNPRVQQLPRGGCPGPFVVDIGELLRLVVLDTQWWLQGEPKPFGDQSGCLAATNSALVDSLRSVLASAGDRTVFVAAHHPLLSSSKHGGYFPWTDYFFPLREVKSWLWVPLPIIGAIYPISRKSGISNQDESGPKYKELRRALEDVFEEYPPLIYAAGHEHILEVLRGQSARYLLVSGSGIYDHSTPVTSRDETLYVAAESGFMRVDLLDDGTVRLGVLVVDGDGNANETYSRFLD